MTTYFAPKFHTVTRAFLICRRVRDKQLTDPYLAPARSSRLSMYRCRTNSRHVWLPPDLAGVALGFPIDTSLAQRKFILVFIPYGRPC